VTGYDVDLWIGVWGPPECPPTSSRNTNSEIRAIVALPEMREQLASQGLVRHRHARAIREARQGRFREMGEGDPRREIKAD